MPYGIRSKIHYISTSTTTGALTVSGGVGISGAIYSGGDGVLAGNTFGIGGGTSSLIVGSSNSANGNRAISIGADALS